MIHLHVELLKLLIQNSTVRKHASKPKRACRRQKDIRLAAFQ
jgi:hypothetical protein